MAQLSGSGFEFLYLAENTQGQFNFPVVGGGVSTTLTAAFDPTTDTDITVASAVGASAGNILIVGDSQNQEIFIIGSGYSSGTTFPMDTNAKMLQRHRIGEAVVEVDPTSNNAWRKMTNANGFNPASDLPIVESDAIVAERLLSDFSKGNLTVNPTLNFEDGYRNIGIFTVAMMNAVYKTTGTVQPTTPLSTDLDGAVVAGATSIVVTSATNAVAGEWVEITDGDSSEVFKIDSSYTTGTTLPVDLQENPRGLRFAHADATVVVERIAPFTHSIKSGTSLVGGITFMLRHAATNRHWIIRGNMNNTWGRTHGADNVHAQINTAWVGKSIQLIKTSIFGTFVERAHILLRHYENSISVDGSNHTKNLVRSITMNKVNNAAGAFVHGSNLVAAIAEGDGRFNGSIDYQYEDEQFHEKVSLQTLTPLIFTYDSETQAGYQVKYNMPAVIFGGPNAPDVSAKTPLEQSQTFSVKKDTGGTNSDVDITIINDEATLLN